MINQIQRMRNQATFSKLFNPVVKFGKKHQIYLDQSARSRGKTSIATIVKNQVIIMVAVAQRYRSIEQLFTSIEVSFVTICFIHWLIRCSMN